MEATIEQKLKSLYNLQLIDTKIDSIRNIRGELPMEVSDLEDEVAGLETRMENLKTELADCKATIDRCKKEIKNSQGLIAKYEEQQTNVKNNREYLALTKEVEMQKLEIMSAEKTIKEMTATIEEKKIQAEQTKVYHEERKADRDAKKAELDNITAETQKEEDAVSKVRAKASKIIDERLIKAYHRIRDNVKNRMGVATIERDACAGCYSKIPPQRQLDIRQRKKIIVCENCGRILVDHDLADEMRATLLETVGEL